MASSPVTQYVFDSSGALTLSTEPRQHIALKLVLHLQPVSELLAMTEELFFYVPIQLIATRVADRIDHIELAMFG